jgi:hypothetical protein
MTHRYIRYAINKRLDNIIEVAANAASGGGVNMSPTKRQVMSKHRRKQFRVSSNTFKKIAEGTYDDGNWKGELNLDEESEFTLYLFSRNNPGSDVDIVTESYDKIKTLRCS